MGDFFCARLSQRDTSATVVAMKKRVVVLFGDGVEDIELVAPVDLMRRAEMDVTLASLTDGKRVRTRGGLFLEADALAKEVTWQDYDGLVLPGGPGVVAMREAGLAARWASLFFHAERMVAAICAAPLVLKDAEIIHKVRYTAHASTIAELPDAELSEKVVVTKNVITSRGAGTALEFGFAIVEHLCGKDVRKRIETDVMFS
jgi:4-methyl-5(b-hydroxyethyl)-thiazole monophosphate biosynthesis